MSSVMTLVRLAVAVMSVALCVSPGTAAWICPPPMSIPGPPSLSPVNPDTLMGTDYKISGFNSRLPAPTSPATVKFDGIAESVGIYIVNESIRQIVNGQGKRETWIDFEFTQNPLTLLSLPREFLRTCRRYGEGMASQPDRLVVADGHTASRVLHVLHGAWNSSTLRSAAQQHQSRSPNRRAPLPGQYQRLARSADAVRTRRFPARLKQRAGYKV